MKIQQNLTEAITEEEEEVYQEAINDDVSHPRPPRAFLSIVDSFLHSQEMPVCASIQSVSVTQPSLPVSHLISVSQSVPVTRPFVSVTQPSLPV